MQLRYGDPQVAIGIVFAVLALMFGAGFAVIARQAGSEVAFERVHTVGYWLRKRWLAFLVVIGVLVVGISFLELPYASGGDAGRTVVMVTGGQFFWSLSPDRVRAGTRVRFDVTAVDVNHGLSLYEPGGHLIGSVQAMPGYHNKLDLTFDKPGLYRIRCFEFCGLNHATMNGSFRVTAR
jgi:Heme/copper-type cytochrome/quinol oxidases, subunit 2